MKKEKKFHNRTQALRSDYYHYLSKMAENENDFDESQKIKRINMGINNKLVEILILNEMVHDKKLKKVI